MVYQRPVIIPNVTRATKEHWDNTFDGIDQTRAALAFASRNDEIPQLFSYFGNKENQYTGPTNFDSGHSMTFHGNGLPVIVGGALTSISPTTSRAMYCRTPNMGSKITRVGSRFRLLPGVATRTNGGTMCIAIADGLIDVTSGVNVNMGAHFICTRLNWSYTVWQQGVGQVVIASGTFATPLLTDYFTEYEVQIWRTGTTAVFDLPDGTRQTVLDARIDSYSGNYAYFETYLPNGQTDDTAAFTHVWASTTVNRIQPSYLTQEEITALRALI